MGKRHIPTDLTIEWLSAAYANRELEPEDVIRELIARAEADADMNIWITPPRMERIRPYLERLEATDPSSLPLWGIPFAIKDNIDCAGIPTTAGCPDYQYMPTENATVVERLVAAGAIPLGKTNLDQFATGLVGTRSPYGETHNALRSELISGGSSSGSAVAVARGQAAFALGTDTAGSGRVPAALNGIVGYKPSLGAWPTKGVVPASASLDCVTVFARSLEDALAVDRVARGFDAGDPWSKDIPAPAPRKPKRFLLPKEPLRFFGPFAKEYEAAWEEAKRRLAAMGADWEPVDIGMFMQAAAMLYSGPYVAERWASLGGFVEHHPGSAFPVTEQVLRSGAEERHRAASLFKSLHELQAYRLEAGKLLEDAVLVMPTAGGTWTRDEVRADPIKTNSEMGIYTNHCNLLDLCAAAVPAASAADRLPFGITFFALAANEGLVASAAETFLNGSPWPSGEADRTLVAVCGLHMRGFPLEKQMLGMGARFVREDRTAPKYEMIKLAATPPRPGLIKKTDGGASIGLELWEVPVKSFGAFVTGIAAPLGIGKVELQDGTEVPGFICEGYAEALGEKITALGSWRAVP
ncbi:MULTISPECIES: allophanate hydrolase [Cohnella]|uniref:allophanate hydrolase n=1 Tax=Cohnella TaxID=329857 RepID=UPI0009B9E069|nr:MULTISPECIES: allophanate hydrolase [Cohnella]MBN2981154.1 allophanate hydrolase [Cohnella algarum]